VTHDDPQPQPLLAHLHGHDVCFVDRPGDGTPLLLVHGVGSSVETWGDVPQRLAAAGHRVVALDLLGHGGSSAGHGDFSLGAHANTMRDLMDHLGIARAHLVGHSLGGGVSLQFAYQYPERVASMTLVSSGGLGPDLGVALRAAALPGADLVLRAASRPHVLRAGSFADRVLGRFGRQLPLFSGSAVQRLQALQDDQRRAAFLATLRSVVGPEGQRVSAVDKLTTLDPHRVLIVWGERDPMVPIQHGRAAHEQLPGSRFVVIEGAGHHPHTHEPEVFTNALLDHLDQLAVTPA